MPKSVIHVRRLPNVSVEDQATQSGIVTQLTIATVQTYCDLRHKVTYWDTHGDSHYDEYRCKVLRNTYYEVPK